MCSVSISKYTDWHLFLIADSTIIYKMASMGHYLTMASVGSESGRAKSLTAALARFSTLLDETGVRSLVDEQCTSLLSDETFIQECETIHQNPRFPVPNNLTPEMDEKPRWDLDEGWAERHDTTITELFTWIGENRGAPAEDVKRQFQSLHELIEEGAPEDNLQRYGSFLGSLSTTQRTQFTEAIIGLLTRRNLTPLLFNWTEWLVLYGIENKKLRPYHDPLLAWKVVQYPHLIKHFHLTTKQKKDIREAAKMAINLPPYEHLPKPLKKELEVLLAKSRRLGVNPRRPLKADVDDANTPTDEAMKEEKRRESRLRQRSHRDPLRTQKITGKKSEN